MIEGLRSIFLNSLELGAIYGIVTLGMAISFRMSGFPDLTMEGSFTSGAAVAAVAIASGVAPVGAMLLAVFFGALAGSCTALLHTKAGVSKLLAGIIMMTVLYTVNLRIMGRPNYSLLNLPAVFNGFGRFGRITIILLLAGLTFAALWCFLRTEFGFFLRASGENPSVVTKSGFYVGTFTVAGLAIANGLIAFAGAVLAQDQGFADIGMGVGLIVVALASLLIGESIVRPTNLLRLLLAAVAGGWIYQFILALGLRLGVGPWDLKLATGVLLAVAVIGKKHFTGSRAQQNIGCDVL